MTKKFDAFYESIINVFVSSQSKRRESRYWNNTTFPSMQPRKVSSLRNKTASQRTKLGNQQYVGNFLSKDGIRTKNKSEKTSSEMGIAKGLGNHIKIKGVNPKEPGATVNSKQNTMEVKYTLGNGLSKVGPKMQKDYSKGMVKRDHLKNYKRKFD